MRSARKLKIFFYAFVIITVIVDSINDIFLEHENPMKSSDFYAIESCRFFVDLFDIAFERMQKYFLLRSIAEYIF